MDKQSGGWKGKRGTRQERGYGAEWQRIRKVIIARDMGLCQPCIKTGKVTPFNEVDHIKPKADGGTDDPDNLQCICRPCHEVKTTAEGAKAKGYRPRVTIGPDGWPVHGAGGGRKSRPRGQRTGGCSLISTSTKWGLHYGGPTKAADSGGKGDRRGCEKPRQAQR